MRRKQIEQTTMMDDAKWDLELTCIEKRRTEPKLKAVKDTRTLDMWAGMDNEAIKEKMGCWNDSCSEENCANCE